MVRGTFAAVPFPQPRHRRGPPGARRRTARGENACWLECNAVQTTIAPFALQPREPAGWVGLHVEPYKKAA